MKKYRGVFLKNEHEIAKMRIANGMVSRVLDALGEAVKPGISTMFLEDVARNLS